MIKKVKQYFAQKKQKKTQEQQLKKMKEYYTLLQSGALFLKYIRQDLQKTSDKSMNRHARRRFLKQLEQKGEFNKEIVDYYSRQVESILNNINNQLKTSK